MAYHVLNRGNGRAQIFDGHEDYDAFLQLVERACQRLALPVIGYCLMPNHFHLVLWPQNDGDLSNWMQWLMTSHVRRHHRLYGESGHIWQGRFKAFASQSDGHLLAVLRYVERNALRANLVQRAEHWRWSSAAWRGKTHVPAWLVPGPMPLPPDWLEIVNTPQSAQELEAIRRSANKGSPYGSDEWVRRLNQR